MLDKKEIRLNELVKDCSIDLEKMYSIALEEDLGFLDGINDREVIEMYITEKMKEGIIVGHILEAIEENPSVELFSIWLGNSMETPSPIRTKEELKEALGY